jgi:hypothetical protein
MARGSTVWRAVCMVFKVALPSAYESFENMSLTQKVSNRRGVCVAGFEPSWHMSALGTWLLIKRA